MIGKGVMYVLVNSDLNMSKGKASAQVAHAVARVDVPAPRTVIVLSATTEQLHNLDRYLDKIPHHLYIDEGANEVLPMSATALAVGNYVISAKPDFLKPFPLYTEAERVGGGSGFLLGLMVATIGAIVWLSTTH